MQATKRTYGASVIDELLDEPQKFAFAQLVSLLLRELRCQGVSYERAFREVLSFRNSLSLAFPVSEVHSLEVETDTVAAPVSLRSRSVKRIRITPAFIGLLGASGTLPLHDTERIAARKANSGDESQRDLLDVLSNRLVGLFYEAWGKYRVEHGLDIRGRDLLLPMLTALAGSGTGNHRQRQQPVNRVKAETVAYFSGLLRARPISASTVKQILAACFGVPIHLEQFVGCWDPIPPNRRSTLGITAPALGVSTALGVRAWRHDLRARLHIGPVDENQVQGFLPGGRSRAVLEEMVSLFVVPALHYEVRLLLAPACIKRFSFNTGTAPRQLGWNTFLTSVDGATRRPEIRAMLRLPAHSSGTA